VLTGELGWRVVVRGQVPRLELSWGGVATLGWSWSLVVNPGGPADPSAEFSGSRDQSAVAVFVASSGDGSRDCLPFCSHAVDSREESSWLPSSSTD
jgi:hypothetical protein